MTLPAGWKEKELQDICRIEIGKTPNRGTRLFWDKEKKTNNTWLTISDMSNDINKYVFSSNENVSDEGAKLIQIVPKGTLLLSFKLTIGRVAFAGKNLRTNEAIAQLPIKDEKEIDKSYLYYYLKNYNYETLLNGDIKVKGKTLNKEKLKHIKVVYPSLLSEQKHIAEKLDKAFESIHIVEVNTEKKIKDLDELKQAVLHKAFQGEL